MLSQFVLKTKNETCSYKTSIKPEASHLIHTPVLCMVSILKFLQMVFFWVFIIISNALINDSNLFHLFLHSQSSLLLLLQHGILLVSTLPSCSKRVMVLNFTLSSPGLYSCNHIQT
uniref:Uncharacterized protein n=1 Tax=Rhizophora mucronata TaxID=61149 RepID=A0A2P2MLU9_RHIMU